MFLSEGVGEVACDRCGNKMPSGSVEYCAVMSFLNEEDNLVVTTHFCKGNGCDKKLMTKQNLKHYNEVREERKRAEARE